MTREWALSNMGQIALANDSQKESARSSHPICVQKAKATRKERGDILTRGRRRLFKKVGRSGAKKKKKESNFEI